LIRLFQKAFQNGLLFHLDLSRKWHDYQIYIDSRISLKTDIGGGGRFVLEKSCLKNTKIFFSF
jgi:hypothetical protein